VVERHPRIADQRIDVRRRVALRPFPVDREQHE
jgi:hypothetical protein